MPGTVQARKHRREQTAEIEDPERTETDSEAKAARVYTDLDALLDEIDATIDENAVEMAANYRQLGGE